MSATSLSLRFGVVVADTDHWSPADLAAAEASDAESYADWAADQLADVMRQAGQRFIAEHPDLFAVEDLI